MKHEPVLLKEVIEHIPTSAKRFIDTTLGSGGHAKTILKKAGGAELLGLDQDESMAREAKEALTSFADRVNIIVANFRDIDLAAKDIGWSWADVILFDLGISSVQLSDPERGFSFQEAGPLDMRIDLAKGLTAGEIVNTWSPRDLEAILRDVGEEPFARRITEKVIAARPLQTTQDLVQVIEAAIPASARYKRKIHPATATFRALRMIVNDELTALSEALPKAIHLLTPGGTIFVISFHSLEDRIVKRIFRTARDLDVITKKPVTPTVDEITRNPRARSAKLRIARRIGNHA